MKKEKLSLTRKLFLRKEPVANLSVAVQHALVGGVQETVNRPYTIPSKMSPQQECICCYDNTRPGNTLMIDCTQQ
ncbi:class I lanthipeptide [Chitinophaga nivalis]|uniref:Class I lanthipeptide n=1 Tax=Chitinophaga nivalis TaxID=2991709 RepID=A0ABT3IGX3_9BACT|nr:class I lanthipeptide [Chitinophaga nivalis]MCW3467138.1 class I lanthipeptide [Chitinophaga nivalis]MCW3483171.1 class I lanthipeptide [Chitinophaga nivalis]